MPSTSNEDVPMHETEKDSSPRIPGSSLGPFGNRPKATPRPSKSACQARPHRPDPGGPEPRITGVPSPPRASPEISLKALNLSEQAKPFKHNPISQKRSAENLAQQSKRSRHLAPSDRPVSPPIKSESQTRWTTAPVAKDTDTSEGDVTMVLEPQTRPITQDQLVNEVKGIYAGLVMVEKKCVEITQQRAKSTNKLSDDQWQALIALHRTLLHEHHDFFLASQHPTASPALKRLANKYAMPARMWRHGIHSFLELLRHQLPDSLDHMLAFVYIAYSMMALLKESVPSFTETWIECLGDLARYRMAIEDSDMRDREIWSNVARTWYNQAADRSPNVGRIQHHLAVLARPNIVQQLFFYTKALVSIVPFVNATDSIMLLFTPLLQDQEKNKDRYTETESSLVIACGVLFTRGSLSTHRNHAKIFEETLNGHIGKLGNKWKVQGPEVASGLIACVMDCGRDKNPIWTMYQEYMANIKARRTLADNADPQAQDDEDARIRDNFTQELWSKTGMDHLPRVPATIEDSKNIDSSVDVTVLALQLLNSAIRINANKIGDRNIVPFMSFILSFLLSISSVGAPLFYIESHIPWHSIVTFLNTLGRSGVHDQHVEAGIFPVAAIGTGCQLPEDFYARGSMWAQHVFPPDFFRVKVTDEDERSLELSDHSAHRSERCLYLGIRLATFGRHIHYDTLSKQFSVTEYASQFQAGGAIDNALPRLANHMLAPQPPLPPRSDTGPGTLGARTADTDPDYLMVDSPTKPH